MAVDLARKVDMSKSRIRAHLTLPLKKRSVVIEDVVLLLIQIL
jgi:hypothetical protein